MNYEPKTLCHNSFFHFDVLTWTNFKRIKHGRSQNQKTHGGQFGAKERHDFQFSGTETTSGMVHFCDGLGCALGSGANAMIEQLRMPWNQTWKTNAFPGLEVR